MKKGALLARPEPFLAVACGYGTIPSGLLGLCNRPPNDQISDGASETDEESRHESAFLPRFPYVATPNQGYAYTGHR